MWGERGGAEGTGVSLSTSVSEGGGRAWRGRRWDGAVAFGLTTISTASSSE